KVPSPRPRGRAPPVPPQRHARRYPTSDRLTHKQIAGATHAPAEVSTIIKSLRRRRKRRQFVNVARIVLDDDGRMQVGLELLEALERGDRLGAIEVERRDAVGLVV